MADLTPEQLDQLEQDVAGWPGGFMMLKGETP